MDAFSQALMNGEVKSGVDSEWRWGCKKCGCYEKGLPNRPAARDGWTAHKKVCSGKPGVGPTGPTGGETGHVGDKGPAGPEASATASDAMSITVDPEPVQEPKEATEPVSEAPVAPEETPSGAMVQSLSERIPCFGFYDADAPECEVCCINEACAAQKSEG